MMEPTDTNKQRVMRKMKDHANFLSQSDPSPQRQSKRSFYLENRREAQELIEKFCPSPSSERDRERKVKLDEILSQKKGTDLQEKPKHFLETEVPMTAQKALTMEFNRYVEEAATMQELTGHVAAMTVSSDITQDTTEKEKQKVVCQ